jgi:hypothetical protein
LVETPPLPLENNLGRPNQPSPFHHLHLHYRLYVDLAKAPAPLDEPFSFHLPQERVEHIGRVIRNWLNSLPAEYTQNPQLHWDGEYGWVVDQRQYLQKMGAAALVNYSSIRPRGRSTPFLALLKAGLSLFGRARLATNTTMACRSIFARPPSQLPEPPSHIMEVFEKFKKSALSDLGDRENDFFVLL